MYSVTIIELTGQEEQMSKKKTTGNKRKRRKKGEYVCPGTTFPEIQQ